MTFPVDVENFSALRKQLRVAYEEEGWEDRGGCCLHNAMEDGNMKERHVRWCMEHAIENGHHKCAQFAVTLLCMNEEQRFKVYER